MVWYRKAGRISLEVALNEALASIQLRLLSYTVRFKANCEHFECENAAILPITFCSPLFSHRNARLLIACRSAFTSEQHKLLTV